MAKRLNEIHRTATFAWSPGQQVPLIAAGTVAGALDDSFSNASELELFRLDLTSSSRDLSPVGKISSPARFNTLAWGCHSPEKPLGVIAGGLENGELALWDPSAILDHRGDDASLILRNSTHSGTIRGLDFNAFQSNLLASAGSNSEIFIWDLSQPDKPYSPGARSMSMDDITSVGWNGQVSHILASTSSSGHTVVWDLRNRKEVMTLSYAGQGAGGISAGTRRGITSLAWHPDVATQLVTGAEDDHNPIITLWDLRHAHSPEKMLAGHQKGVLGLSWCRQDADLLLSCGKDCRTLCWNPQTGELVGQLSQNTNWTFQASWCPRNPDLLASASFDGQINVFSLQGAGDNQPAETKPSVHADDPFSAAMRQAVPATPSFALKHPPKWLRRPVGASFGFGGKLVYFNNKAGEAAVQAAAALPPGTAPVVQQVPRHVTLANVVTEPEIAKQSDELEAALQAQNLPQLIDERRQQSGDNRDEQESWDILRTLYDDNARDCILKYLGFHKDDIVSAVAKLTLGKNPLDSVTLPTASGAEEPTHITSPNAANVPAADFFGQTSATSPEGTDFFAGQDTNTFSPPQPRSQTAPAQQQPFQLYPSSGSDVDKAITRAVVLGDFESAVNVCITSNRWADALMFAICGGDDLLSRTRLVYFEQQTATVPYMRLLESVLNNDLVTIVRQADLHEWESVIAILCTFARAEDFGPLSETLGARLEDAWAMTKDVVQGREFRRRATLCYLASGNLEKVTGIWIVEQEEQEKLETDRTHGASLQHFVEKVTVFRNAIGFEDPYLADTTSTHFPLGPLYYKYCQYAELLATQGKLSTALQYLSLTPAHYQASDVLPVARDRIYHACGRPAHQKHPQPAFPFESVALAAAPAPFTQQQQQPAPVQQQQQQQSLYGQSAYPAFTGNNAAANNMYGNTYGSTTSSYQPAPYTQAYQPQQVQHQPAPAPPVASAPPTFGAPTNTYAPQPGYGMHASAASYPNPYETSAPATNAVVPPPPPPMGGLRKDSTISSPSRSSTPANMKNSTGAWNDPPMLANPNILRSPRLPSQPSNGAVSHAAANRVTSPFPNAPAPSTFMPPPPQQHPQQPYMQQPPPFGAPPNQGGLPPPPPQASQLPPPPMNASAPTPLAKQAPPPPPQQQGFYQPNRPMATPPHPPTGGVMPSPHQNFAPNPAYMPQQQQQPNQFQNQPPMQRPPPPPAMGYGAPPRPNQPPQQQFPNQPPPPGSQMNAMPPHGQNGVMPPPPGAQNMPSPAPAKQSPAPPPQKPRHPNGDRSHIPPAQRPIFDILSQEVQQQKQRCNPAQKKMLDDTEKRLNSLFDAINNGDLSDDVIQPMLKLAQAIQQRDFSGAHRIQVELVTTKYTECGAWLLGVKRMIDNAQTM
ncbi:hypothetical protein DM01DRAFT_1331515 [Hesseltinella vesiculosa]|uniref:Protein transport protein SEC31 n=1 Tax=Hesseltinella vesiculosa TaxID=101127 RepID=A0A1X2GVJ2_9FUNG|nr:hypothetical protein DM01DRAFT_1331515 [Hesseltinella vesiculosa]